MKAIIYLLQVSACTGIFYAFYFLLLRRMTFFTLNRWYLLGTLLLSFVIPAMRLSIDGTQSLAIMQPVVYVNQMQVIDEPLVTVQFAPIQNTKQSFNWVKLTKTAYVVIAVISLMHLLFTLLVFARRMKNKQLMQIGNVKVLRGSKKLGNSSFLNVIFINDDELEPNEIRQIIAHELLHVKLMHSADRLLARLMLIVLWFNPFAYCYIRSIEENHEFEVDCIAAGEADKGLYATLLFKLSVSGQSYLMHSFSKVPLRSRIAMLFNKPTSNMKKIIYVLIAPVVLVSCLAFANLETKISVKKHPFYTLNKTTTPEGIKLETRTIFLPNCKAALKSQYKAGENVVFIVDGKAFGEDEVNNVERIIIQKNINSGISGNVNDYRGITDKDISEYGSYFEFNSKIADTTLGINKYRQIDRLIGKHNPYPDFSKSTDFLRKRKTALRIGDNVVTYKITGDATNATIPHGYTMTNEGEDFILSTIYGSKKQLDGKLNIGDQIQVKGKAIALTKSPMVVIMAENIKKDGVELINKLNTEETKDTTAFLFEGNRVRYTYGKITGIQKYPNGKWKTAVVVKENGYRIKFHAKPNAPWFTNITEGNEVTFRFVHEVRTGAKEYTVNDWVAISNDIKDYGIKNPDYFYKFYEKI